MMFDTRLRLCCGRIAITLVALASLTGCASEGARENVEIRFNWMIGKRVSDELLAPANTICEERNKDYGCLFTSTRSGCRIWFSVDRQSNLITGWMYAGDPQDCWHDWHGY